MAGNTRTIVYRYGLLAPTRGSERVSEQILLAHRYQNVLIEIERERREALSAATLSHPKVVPAAECVDELSAELEDLRAAANEVREKTRRRQISRASRDEIKGVREALREARRELRRVRAELRETAGVRAAMAEANERAKARRKAERAASGVYWGTYLEIEQAVDDTRRNPQPPRFRRWTGDGAVVVQLQGGLPVGGASSCADRRLQLSLEPEAVPGRSGKPRPRVRLRVGSEGRSPVWAEWPVIFHRPLPTDAVVKRARALRRRVAGKDAWSLHLVLELPKTWSAQPCGRGVVAVDLGWRRVGTQLRAGSYAGSDGGRGEVLMERAVEGELQKVAELRQVRDKRLNEMRAALTAMLKPMELPEEHRERAAQLVRWRSPTRFAQLAIWWRDHRTPGDEEIYELLEGWRRRDRHLWLWETHGRRGAVARRRDQYRRLAAELARRYEVLVVERLDLRSLTAVPGPESDRDESAVVRRQRFLVGPGVLRKAVVDAFRMRGGEVATVPPTAGADEMLRRFTEGSTVEVLPRAPSEGRFQRAQDAAQSAEGAARA